VKPFCIEMRSKTTSESILLVRRTGRPAVNYWTRMNRYVWRNWQKCSWQYYPSLTYNGEGPILLNRWKHIKSYETLADFIEEKFVELI